MTQIQFVGITPADLVATLEASLVPNLLEKLAKQFQPKEPIEYLTTVEVCEILKIDPVTLWRWRKKDLIRAYGTESKVLFKRTEIDDFVNKNLLK